MRFEAERSKREAGDAPGHVMRSGAEDGTTAQMACRKAGWIDSDERLLWLQWLLWPTSPMPAMCRRCAGDEQSDTARARCLLTMPALLQLLPQSNGANVSMTRSG